MVFKNKEKYTAVIYAAFVNMSVAGEYTALVYVTAPCHLHLYLQQ